MATLPKNVDLQKVHPDAKTPFRATDRAAGHDLIATEDIVMYPFVARKINTGLLMKLPNYVKGQVLPRSGMSLEQGWIVHPGLIDEDFFTKPIQVIMMNFWPWPRVIRKGDRVAQITFSFWLRLTPRYPNTWPISEGNPHEGFGSTGRNIRDGTVSINGIRWTGADAQLLVKDK